MQRDKLATLRGDRPHSGRPSPAEDSRTAGDAGITRYASMHPDNPLVPHTAAPLNPGDLVTEREAAAILGVSRQTLSNWRWLRRGPKVSRIGLRLVRYHRADLAAFIAGDAGKDEAA